jgi:hypothetical protein
MHRTIVISAFVALILVLASGSLLSVSYYRRWEASKLLAVVRQLHPGVTTEVQARALLTPFAQSGSGRQTDAHSFVQYQFSNTSGWNPLQLILPWTLFEVNIEFAHGAVGRIDVTEMQEDHRGYPHPNSVSVSIYSSQLQPLPVDFKGFSEYSRSTGQVGTKGNWTGFECCHERFIKLDERATPVQLARSLNFRLSCMTSFIRCKDDRQILP